MGDEDALLAANGAFYMALGTGDLVAMERLWADRPQVSCVHPGWAPLLGRAEVMASWRALMARPQTVKVEEERVALHGDAALVLCRERIGQTAFAASNLYARRSEEHTSELQSLMRIS